MLWLLGQHKLFFIKVVTHVAKLHSSFALIYQVHLKMGEEVEEEGSRTI